MKKHSTCAACAGLSAALLVLTSCGANSEDLNEVGRELVDDFITGISTGDSELALRVSCGSLATEVQMTAAFTAQSPLISMTIDEYGEAEIEEEGDGGVEAFTFPIEITAQYETNSRDVNDSLVFDIEKASGETTDGEWCISNMR